MFNFFFHSSHSLFQLFVLGFFRLNMASISWDRRRLSADEMETMNQFGCYYRMAPVVGGKRNWTEGRVCQMYARQLSSRSDRYYLLHPDDQELDIHWNCLRQSYQTLDDKYFIQLGMNRGCETKEFYFYRGCLNPESAEKFIGQGSICRFATYLHKWERPVDCQLVHMEENMQNLQLKVDNNYINLKWDEFTNCYRTDDNRYVQLGAFSSKQETSLQVQMTSTPQASHVSVSHAHEVQAQEPAKQELPKRFGTDGDVSLRTPATIDVFQTGAIPEALIKAAKTYLYQNGEIMPVDDMERLVHEERIIDYDPRLKQYIIRLGSARATWLTIEVTDSELDHAKKRARAREN